MIDTKNDEKSINWLAIAIDDIEDSNENDKEEHTLELAKWLKITKE